MKKILPEKFTDGLFKLKTYWNKPPKGYYVSYKEFVNLSLGFGVMSFISVLITMATFDTAKDMMIFFKVSTGQVWLFGLITTLVGLVRAPIMSMCIDNCNSKRGKFKPFILPATIITALVFCFIPYIPLSWNNSVIGGFTIPAMPLMNIFTPERIIFTPAIVALWVLITIGQTSNTFLSQSLNGIEQTITPVSQERSTIAALRGLICNIPSSVANIIPGVLLMFGAFKKEEINGAQYFPLTMNKILFPICGVLAICLVAFVVKGTHQRVVMTKGASSKVKFTEGVKDLSSNKYFWIITAYVIIIGLRALINIAEPIRQYSFVGNESLAGLADLFNKTLLMNALVLGMILGPVFIKKFGKRRIMAIVNIGFAFFALIQVLCYKYPWLMLFCQFCENLCLGFDFIYLAMQSDALDYEQYRHGKRLEGFWQNYHLMILTIAGLFTAIIAPLIASYAGIGFGSDFGEAIRSDSNVRDKWFLYRSITGAIAGVIAIIPMLFFDLSEKQHSSIVKAIKIRSIREQHEDGETLLDSEIIAFAEIHKTAIELNDNFILGKIAEFETANEVLAMYDEALERLTALEEKEKAEQFERNIEFETKKLKNKLAKAESNASKKGKEFNSEKFINDYVYYNRYLRELPEYAECKAKHSADNEKARIATFENNLAKEEAQYQKQKAKAMQVGGSNEDEFRNNFVMKSKFIIKLPEYAEMLKVRDEEREIQEKAKNIADIQKANISLEKIKVKVRGEK